MVHSAPHAHCLYDTHSILLYLMSAFNVMANKERGGEFACAFMVHSYKMGSNIQLDDKLWKVKIVFIYYSTIT